MLKAARERLGGARQKLAGKYNQLMDAAISDPAAALGIGALGAGGLGAAGSLIGNLTDAEQGEGPLRLLTEAGNAAMLAAPLGVVGVANAGARRKLLTNPRTFREFQALHGGDVNAVEQQIKNYGRSALGSAAAIPLAAGIGGMLGGGTANMYNAIGIPGFAPGAIPNPEDPNLSSNSPGARYKAPTTQYV
jgi:hypothetical protein